MPQKASISNKRGEYGKKQLKKVFLKKKHNKNLIIR